MKQEKRKKKIDPKMKIMHVNQNCKGKKMLLNIRKWRGAYTNSTFYEYRKQSCAFMMHKM